jgi:hypothetical protein
MCHGGDGGRRGRAETVAAAAGVVPELYLANGPWRAGPAPTRPGSGLLRKGPARHRSGVPYRHTGSKAKLKHDSIATRVVLGC